ncbi:type II toxin-antitoxin system VapC family toxin [bacterium]|nr:type II toxin-antitoxin system VapC family toxin [bacterium]
MPLTIEEISAEIATLKTVFQIADETSAVRDKLLDLLKAFPTQGKQVHDANLVATMLANGINQLLTLNDADFKRFSGQIHLVSPKIQP